MIRTTIVFFFFPICLFSQSRVIYLIGDDRYATLEMLSSLRDPATGETGTYIRSTSVGRFASESDKANIVSVSLFEKLRNSSPVWAAAGSLLFFDAGRSYTTGDRHFLGTDGGVRTVKIGLLALTGAAFAATRSASNEMDASFRYINHKGAERRFRTMRAAYYGVGLFTLAYFGWATFTAWRDFGRDAAGRDLRISERREVDPSEILRRPESRSGQTGGDALTLHAEFPL